MDSLVSSYCRRGTSFKSLLYQSFQESSSFSSDGQAALFAAMEATIITLAKTQEPDGHPPLRFSSSYQNAVLGLAYVALILNVGSIVSALKIIDAIGRIAYRNAVKEPRPKPDASWPIQGPNALMKTYGVKGRVRLLMWHCAFSISV